MMEKLKSRKLWAVIVASMVLPSCSSVDREPVKVVPKVSIPVAPKAPNIVPVEIQTREIQRDVTAAAGEVRRASDKIAEGVEEASRINRLTEAAYEKADAAAQVALGEIHQAVSGMSKKMAQTAAMLITATESLEKAESTASMLSAEVSDLKAILDVQTSRVEQFREIAAVANARVDEVNSENGKIKASYDEASALVAVAQAGEAKARKLAFRLIWFSVSLTLIITGLIYMIIKI